MSIMVDARKKVAPQSAERNGRAVKRLAPPAWKRFPVEALPEPARGYIDAQSRALGCDACYVALPVLTGFASAIGNTRTIRLKRGWTEPAVLWTAIVGESGTPKSPALHDALEPIRKRQQEAMRRHRSAMEEYEELKARFEAELARWKRGGGKGEPPEKPAEPICE